jgi:hypothetical protein
MFEGQSLRQVLPMQPLERIKTIGSAASNSVWNSQTPKHRRAVSDSQTLGKTDGKPGWRGPFRELSTAGAAPLVSAVCTCSVSFKGAGRVEQYASSDPAGACQRAGVPRARTA